MNTGAAIALGLGARLRRWWKYEARMSGRGRLKFSFIFFYFPIALTLIALTVIALVTWLWPDWLLNTRL
jgi:hypothetical protein